MREDPVDVRRRDPREEESGSTSILVRAYLKSQADWERMLTAPQPPGRLLAIGAGLGGLEGSLLGGLQGGRDGALGGAFYGLFLGVFIAASGWRVRRKLRKLALAMFLGLLVEAIGSIILGQVVHLNAKGALPGKLNLRFLTELPVVLTIGIAFVVALHASWLASLRRSVIAGTAGAAIAGPAALVFFAIVIPSDPNCPCFMIPILAVMFLFGGLFVGVVAGILVGGILGATIKALRRLAASFRDEEFDAMFKTAEEIGRSSPGPASSGGAPTILVAPAGQEPLPRWVPERVQIRLWSNWIQLDRFYRRLWRRDRTNGDRR